MRHALVGQNTQCTHYHYKRGRNATQRLPAANMAGLNCNRRRDECQHHRRWGGARGIAAITGAEVLTARRVKVEPLALVKVVTSHRH